MSGSSTVSSAALPLTCKVSFMGSPWLLEPLAVCGHRRYVLVVERRGIELRDELTHLLGRKDPRDQRLNVRVGNIVGRHRNRAPNPTAAILDFLLELRGSARVAGVLRGDLLVGRSDDLLVRRMACRAVVFGRQRGRVGGRHADCGCGEQRTCCGGDCESCSILSAYLVHS